MEQPPWWTYSIMSLFFFVVLIVLNFIVNKINAHRIEARFAEMEKSEHRYLQKLEMSGTEGNQYHTTSRDPDNFNTNTRTNHTADNPSTEGRSYQSESLKPDIFKTNTRTDQEADNPTSEADNPTSEADNPTLEADNPTSEGNSYQSESLNPDICKTNTRTDQEPDNPTSEGNSYLSESLDPDTFNTLDTRASFTDVSKPQITNQSHTIVENVEKCRGISIFFRNVETETNITESENNNVEKKERSPKQ